MSALGRQFSSFLIYVSQWCYSALFFTHCIVVFCTRCFVFQPISSIVVMPEAKNVIAGSWDNNMCVCFFLVFLCYNLITSSAVH